MPGSGTTAGMGVPATISPSGSARAGCRTATFQREGIPVEALRIGPHVENGAGLEHVMDTPVRPHALREVGIIMAVIDGVARGTVAVTGPAKCDLVGIGAARTDALRIDIARIVIIRIVQPLMVVQVEDVMLLGTRMQVPELHEIADVGMSDVGRIIREFRIACADVLVALAERIARLRRAEFKAGIRRHIDEHRRIADRERGQEEFFVRA